MEAGKSIQEYIKLQNTKTTFYTSGQLYFII